MSPENVSAGQEERAANPWAEISRRELLRRSAVGGLAIVPGISLLAGCGGKAEKEAKLAAGKAESEVVLLAGRGEESPDGRRRQVYCYDGTIPGPTIRAKLGEKLRVRVVNELDVPTTVHWHGLHQPGTWQMDGVANVTQTPIPPEGSFDYEFTATPAGTHWYHSHTGVQYGDGLFGPLVVEEETPIAQYDREEILFINDWFLKPSEEILAELTKAAAGQMQMKPGEKMPAGESEGAAKMDAGKMKMADKGDGAAADEAAGAKPMSGKMPGMKMAADIGDVPFESALINGLGRFGDDAGPPASIEVKPGETLRLRLINGSTTYAFRLQIDGHRLTVIASDGAPLQPVDVDNLVINIGERYDVLLKANGSDVVWIRAATLAGDEALAVLRYPNSAAEPEPSPVKWGEQMLTPEQMKSLKPVVLADNPQVVPLQLGGTMSPYAWSINDQVYPKADPIVLPANVPVRFVMENTTRMDHPFHLHGHYFRVLGKPDALNLVDPPEKDTVNIPAGSTLVLQWETTNPGKWFYHCHIEWHAVTGMARVIEIKPPA